MRWVKVKAASLNVMLTIGLVISSKKENRLSTAKNLRITNGIVYQATTTSKSVSTRLLQATNITYDHSLDAVYEAHSLCVWLDYRTLFQRRLVLPESGAD